MSSGFSMVSDEQTLKDWLAEYKSLSEAALVSYVSNINSRTEVIGSFKRAIESHSENALMDLVQPSCHQIFEFYRSSWKELNTFALGFIPVMIGGYMKSCFTNAEAAHQCKLSIGAYLLSIYNLMPRGKINSPHCSIESFPDSVLEIPSLTHASIFHDPMTYPFSELCIASRNTNLTFLQHPTLETYNSILPSNRYQIMAAILSFYSDQLPLLEKSSLQQVCLTCSQLASQGFPWYQIPATDEERIADRRIPLNTSLCVILLRCVYFALYHGCRSLAVKAVEAMHRRAEFELNAQVMVLCNAILRTSYQERVKSADDTLGMSVSLTPMIVRTYSGLSRSAVTASSIRHHQWRHDSEEVSGDVSDTLYQENIPAAKSASTPVVPPSTEHAFSKTERIPASPAKLLKNKLKKAVPAPSTSYEKSHKSAPTSASDRKSKKKLTSNALCVEDGNRTFRQRTASGASVDLSETNSQSRISSISVPSLKLMGVDDEDAAPVSPRKTSMQKSSSVDQDDSKGAGMPAKNQTAEDGVPLSGRKKCDKGKTRNPKQVKDSESKDVLSMLRRSGSKKLKDASHTTNASATKEGVPLLNSPTSCEEEEEASVSTQL